MSLVLIVFYVGFVVVVVVIVMLVHSFVIIDLMAGES